jgi:hypothetical protein
MPICGRAHQSLGMAVPWDRFRLAAKVIDTADVDVSAIAAAGVLVDGATRRVGSTGFISFAGARYHAARWLAGEDVVVVCDNRLAPSPSRRVDRHPRAPPHRRQTARRAAPRAPPEAATATTINDRAVGNSQGRLERRCQLRRHAYAVGMKYRRRQVQVAVIGETVEISTGEELILTHAARHDRTREHGALANPGGRPRRINAA